MAQSSIRKYCACGVIVGFQNIIVDPGSTAQQKGERLNLRQCEIHDDRKHRLVLLAAARPDAGEGSVFICLFLSLLAVWGIATTIKIQNQSKEDELTWGTISCFLPINCLC
eukprot:28607_1